MGHFSLTEFVKRIEKLRRKRSRFFQVLHGGRQRRVLSLPPSISVRNDTLALRKLSRGENVELVLGEGVLSGYSFDGRR